MSKEILYLNSLLSVQLAGSHLLSAIRDLLSGLMRSSVLSEALK
jgi:hypothetical protein